MSIAILDRMSIHRGMLENIESRNFTSLEEVEILTDERYCFITEYEDVAQIINQWKKLSFKFNVTMTLRCELLRSRIRTLDGFREEFKGFEKVDNCYFFSKTVKISSKMTIIFIITGSGVIFPQTYL